MKRSMNVALLTLVASLVFSATVWCQTVLDKRISVEFNTAPVAGALRIIAQSQGLEPVIDPSLSQNFSFRLNDVTVRTALDALCDSVSCRWRIEDNKLIVDAVPRDPSRVAREEGNVAALEPLRRLVPQGTRFDNVPVSSALDSLARLTGDDVQFSVRELDANQSVTVDVGGRTVQQAIMKVVAAAGMKPGARCSIMITKPGQKPTILATVIPSREE